MSKVPSSCIARVDETVYSKALYGRYYLRYQTRTTYNNDNYHSINQHHDYYQGVSCTVSVSVTILYQFYCWTMAVRVSPESYFEPKDKCRLFENMFRLHLFVGGGLRRTLNRKMSCEVLFPVTWKVFWANIFRYAPCLQ